MTKQKLIELYNALNSFGSLKGVKFSYGVIKNLKLMQLEIDALNKSIEPSKEIKEFEEKRIELAKSFAKKDDKGEPVSEGNHYIFEDEKAFGEAFAKLREEYKTASEAHEERVKAYLEILKEESDVKFYEIKLEDIPEDVSVAQMNALIDIIKE